MTHLPSRRAVVFALAAAPFAAAFAHDAGQKSVPAPGFAALERDLDGRLGVFAVDTGSGKWVGHREDERFPMCSTFKTLVASAVLARSVAQPGLLNKRLALPKAGFVSYSPITGKHVDGDMAVGELCAAMLRYSDNTAANVLMKELGGPAEVTRHARSLGDGSFRLDRWETALNSAVPGDERDTSTPRAMAGTLRALLLQDALAAGERQQLRDWMLGNTTSGERLRAAVATDWLVADKTGAGDYGTNNDAGVLYPPGRAPIVLAVYTTRRASDANVRNDIVVAAARLALGALTAAT